MPLTWSDTQNVKWKIPLEHQGNSTPVIWGERIFLTQANKDGEIRSLLCLARADGKLLWQRDVPYGEKERNWNPNWYANASPMTDGQRVVVSFASAGLYCFDFEGQELWKRTDLGKWEHAFGSGSSPLLYRDLAILWCGPNENGRNFLLAVNKATGETVWEADQAYGSWSTPLATKVSGQDQLLLGLSKDVKSAPLDKTGFLYGFDPQSGKELWRCQGLSSYVYTSSLYSPEHGIAVGMSGFGGSALAVKLGGLGDITADRLWHHPQAARLEVVDRAPDHRARPWQALLDFHHHAGARTHAGEAHHQRDRSGEKPRRHHGTIVALFPAESNRPGRRFVTRRTGKGGTSPGVAGESGESLNLSPSAVPTIWRHLPARTTVHAPTSAETLTRQNKLERY